MRSYVWYRRWQPVKEWSWEKRHWIRLTIFFV